MRVGTFTLIRNEEPWIRAHLESWLPHVDEMVFFDGNSTDGTLQILDQYEACGKVKVFRDKDPKDLCEDYVRLFNDCLHSLDCDYAIFAHPDMILDAPGNIRNLGEHHAYFTHIRSFAGEPGGELHEFVMGRASRWKNVYRLRNPDLGLHYYGNYGVEQEDCYFLDITGDEYMFWGENFTQYPYSVGDSGIKILHYSDVRPLSRRVERMVRCLINQGHSEDSARAIAATHPRVDFKPDRYFDFKAAQYHRIFDELKTGAGAR